MRRLHSRCDGLLIGSAAARIHFPSFRRPGDWDLYGTPEFATRLGDRLRVVRRGRHKLIGYLGRTRIDITIAWRGSWIEPILRANDASMWFPRFGCHVARPATLRLIQDVLSRFPEQWSKHMLDFLFFRDAVCAPYSRYERLARQIGVAGFSRQYADVGRPVVAGGGLDTLLAAGVGADVASLRHIRCRIIRLADVAV